ncbi:hypothetical protein F4779DRAFT_627337 [Xylariaceae sp. FL0662B]|nr:hypothetical protein F4779DRAFT_627337 [Xylariaceae sp. FL0662B]
MSVPPQIIRVKRKAAEEAPPISFLRVQENKRLRSEAFVYQREQEQAKFAQNIPLQLQKPIIHTSQPGDKRPAFQSPEKQNTQTNGRTSDNDTKNEPANVPAEDVSTVGPTSEPRRFHMSKSAMMLASAPNPSRTHGGVSKKRSAPTLFVERRIKRISSRPFEKLQAITNVTTPAPTSTPAAAEGMEVGKAEPRKLKKPGVAKLTPKGDASKYKADLPKTMIERWNVDMEKLAADMDTYTMQQIGLNLQKANDEKEHELPAKKNTSSIQHRFKPKAPAKRYAERHPETVQSPVDKAMIDADVGISDSDEDGYIIETYVRIPASKMGEHVSPQNVGLLVFDAEPDMEFFYGEGTDSEDEWAEDDEDENAENYYTADYPDEEVASDDEFNQNPYFFRNGNASDLEEYDVRDESDESAWSDKDMTSRFKSYIGRNGLRTNHL